ncbi:MAG: hypothetical protein HY678_06565 [Chloroflexi bacterium]|nr:hypothetical protein [Chloroflexota bacterium]
MEFVVNEDPNVAYTVEVTHDGRAKVIRNGMDVFPRGPRTGLLRLWDLSRAVLGIPHVITLGTKRITIDYGGSQVTLSRSERPLHRQKLDFLQGLEPARLQFATHEDSNVLPPNVRYQVKLLPADTDFVVVSRQDKPVFSGDGLSGTLRINGHTIKVSESPKKAPANSRTISYDGQEPSIFRGRHEFIVHEGDESVVYEATAEQSGDVDLSRGFTISRNGVLVASSLVTP